MVGDTPCHPGPIPYDSLPVRLLTAVPLSLDANSQGIHMTSKVVEVPAGLRLAPQAISAAKVRRQAMCSVTIGVAALFFPGSGASQQGRPIVLRPVNAVSEEGFSKVSSVRELRDGSLLVADQGEQRLVRVTFDSNIVAVLGRIGDGPAEVRSAGWLYPLAGDSTLFTDSSMSRWFILEGSRIVETIAEHGTLNRLLLSELSGADEFGHVLGVRGSVFAGTGPRTRGTADSLVLLLADRHSQRVDTLGMLKGRGNRGFHTERATNRQTMQLVVSTPLASEDVALLFQDGWIAVARVEPYRVEWRAPNGRWSRGAPLPFQAIKVDDKQKCAAMERFFGRSNPCDPSRLPGWPDVVPPFLPAMLRTRLPALLATPDGRLVVARSPTATSPENRYDVVDRAGRLDGVIALGKQEVLIGFGARSVYVLIVDDDGIQNVRRHPWP